MLVNAAARSFARFSGLALVSFATNVGLTALLHEVAKVPEEAAFAVSLLTVFTMNFFACRHFVFKAESHDPRRQLVLFTLSSMAFRLGEYLAFLVVHTWLRTPYLIALLGVLGVSFLTKFFYYRVVVFSEAGVS